MKNFFIGIGCIALFVAYFGLSLSCATPPSKEVIEGAEISVIPIETECDWDYFDIQLVSEAPSPSRILKLIRKDLGKTKVSYVVSAPGDTKVMRKKSSSNDSSLNEEDPAQARATDGNSLIEVDENLVTTGELTGKYLISEEDAKRAVEFINQLEKDFKSERTGEGVLNKFELFEVVEHNERIFIPTSVENSECCKKEIGEYKTVSWKERTARIFFIQHSTAYGKDEILYSANNPKKETNFGELKAVPPMVVTLEEILAVRDALAK